MSYSDFEQRLASDSGFASKISSAKTPEDIVQIANAEGVDIKISDISDLDQLSIDQLSQVSGGMAAFNRSFGSKAKSVTTRESVPACTAVVTDTKDGTSSCSATTTNTNDGNPACGGSFTMKLK